MIKFRNNVRPKTMCAGSAAMRRMFFKQGSPDFYFEFDNSDGTSQQITAHKRLLSAFSPVFKVMLSGNWIEKTSANIVDASHDTFKEFISYFYTNKINIDDDNIDELLYLGHKYDVHDVESHCENYLAERVTINNLFESLKCASTYNLELLDETCKAIMTYNTELVIKSSACRKGDANMLKDILKMSSPIYNKNDKIFEACIEWAKYKCRQSNEDDSDVQLIRNKLNTFFELTQFDKVTPEIFIKYARTYKGLFTADEMHNTITQAGWLLQQDYLQKFWYKAPPSGLTRQGVGFEAFHVNVSKCMFLRALEIGKLIERDGNPINYYEVLGLTVLRFQVLSDASIYNRSAAVIECDYTYKEEDDKVIIDLSSKNILMQPKYVYAVLLYTDTWDRYSYSTFVARSQRLHNVNLTLNPTNLSTRTDTIFSGLHLESRTGSTTKPTKWKCASSLMDDSDSDDN